MELICQSVSRNFLEISSALYARLCHLRRKYLRPIHLCEERASAIVEVALTLSLLGVPLLLGVVDVADLVYGSIEIANAAHAGAIYGMTSATYASDTSGITTAAQTEASDYGTKLSVTPTTYYACSASIAGTQYTSQSAATAACSGSGNHALQFIQVDVSAVITPPIHCPGLPTSYTVSNTSVEEVEE